MNELVITLRACADEYTDMQKNHMANLLKRAAVKIEELERYSIFSLISNGLNVDGDHHKQWYLEQLAERFGFEIPHEDKGIAP